MGTPLSPIDGPRFIKYLGLIYEALDFCFMAPCADITAGTSGHGITSFVRERLRAGSPGHFSVLLNLFNFFKSLWGCLRACLVRKQSKTRYLATRTSPKSIYIRTYAWDTSVFEFAGKGADCHLSCSSNHVQVSAFRRSGFTVNTPAPLSAFSLLLTTGSFRFPVYSE